MEVYCTSIHAQTRLSAQIPCEDALFVGANCRKHDLSSIVSMTQDLAPEIPALNAGADQKENKMALAHSNQLTLRRLDPKDIDVFLAYRSDPSVAKFQGWKPMERSDAKGFLGDMAKAPLLVVGEWTQLAIANIHDDTLIGDIGVHIATDECDAELGITLAASAQGRSIGFEAVEMICAWLFVQTKINRIVAITHAQNTRALALLARSPFEHTHDTNDVIDGVATPERWFERRRN
jgi:RimJ/RimL family protein N-acetyltransferase